MRGNGDPDQDSGSDSSGNGGEKLDSGYDLQATTRKYANGLDVACETKKNEVTVCKILKPCIFLMPQHHDQ